MRAQLFFRPESVEFLDQGAGADSAPNHGSAIIERVTFLGNSADVTMHCNELKLRARMHPARAPTAGKPVHFVIAPNSCIVFPADA